MNDYYLIFILSANVPINISANISDMQKYENAKVKWYKYGIGKEIR